MEREKKRKKVAEKERKRERKSERERERGRWTVCVFTTERVCLRENSFTLDGRTNLFTPWVTPSLWMVVQI